MNVNIDNNLLFNNLKVYNKSLSNVLYLTCGSSKKCLFTCGFHINKQEIYKKTKRKQNCPLCVNQKIDHRNILSSILFNNLKVYNRSSSNILYFSSGSHKKFLFTCGFHINKQTINNKTKRNQNCGKCINQNINHINVLNSLLFNNLKVYNQSLCDDLWLTPGSNKKCVFTCGFHISKQQIYNKTLSGDNCRKCDNQFIDNTNILSSILFNNLKVYNQSLSNTLYFSYGSRKKCLFTCGFHINKQIINGKTKQKQNCGKCVNQTVNHTNITSSLLFNNLKVYNQSLSNILYLPRGSHKICLFTCGIHINKQMIGSKTNYKNPTGCGKCISSKLEKYCRYILNNLKIEFKEQKTFKNCKDKELLKFDFYLVYYKILIELDGEQHFKNVDHFGINSLQDNMRRDKIKNDYCEKNKIRFLRISYSEIKNMRQDIIDFIKSNTLIRFVGKEYQN